jgi:hypothetical protein
MKKAGISGGPSAKAKRESRARVQTTIDGGPRPKIPDRTYREGRYLIAGYFDASVKSSLRQIQVSHLKKTVQELLEEALNDLFAKYKVRQVAPQASKRGRRVSNEP